MPSGCVNLQKRRAWTRCTFVASIDREGNRGARSDEIDSRMWGGKLSLCKKKPTPSEVCVDETVHETDTHFQDSFQCFSFCLLRLIGSGVFDLFACRCREQSLLYSDMCRRDVQCRVWAPASRSLDLDFSVTVLTSVYPSKTPDPLPAGQLLCLFLRAHTQKNRNGLIQKRAWKHSIVSILLETCL